MTEKTVATRQTINARAQERKANFLPVICSKRRMIRYFVWSKWQEIRQRQILAKQQMARAMAFFKSRTELTYFRVWKENRKLDPYVGKLLHISPRIPLGHHNFPNNY